MRSAGRQAKHWAPNPAQLVATSLGIAQSEIERLCEAAQISMGGELGEYGTVGGEWFFLTTTCITPPRLMPPTGVSNVPMLIPGGSIVRYGRRGRSRSPAVRQSWDRARPSSRSYRAPYPIGPQYRRIENRPVLGARTNSQDRCPRADSA
jgi:hypothetical protein